ncbi:uncharacterized protein J3R85_020877 [Psidium guajava]|nr:uncharacterized protein J3R85_020877 [Psidium guajava]
MSKGNGVLVPFVFFLVSTSLLSPRSLASGSPGTGDGNSCGRRDPSRLFKCYHGGYDLWNKHYWASAAFTGVHGYAIAGAWMLSGLGFGIVILSKGESTSSTDPSDLQRVVVTSLVLLLTILAMYIAHIVIVAVNMVLITGAIVLLLLHWHPGLIMIILFCWILTTLCWVITGIDFFIHTLAEDTCSAFKGYVQNPKNNSLATILPCMDSSYSDQLMTEIGSTIYNFFTQLNAKTTALYRSLGIGDLGDELPGVLKICEPFSGPPNYSYVPGNCSKDDIPVGDLPNVLAQFTCYQGNSPGKCKSEGKFVPESAYYMACAYSRSIQDLIDMYPDLKGLSECSFVKDRFEEAVLHQCRPFRASTHRSWSSMLALSIVMVALVLAWVVKACQDRGRAFSRCSIFPNS